MPDEILEQTTTETVEEAADQIIEIAAEAVGHLEQTAENTGSADGVTDVAAIAEAAVVLAQEQSALAEIQAAHTIEEHSAHVRQLEEKIEWLTTQIADSKTAHQAILSQLENLHMQLQTLTPMNSNPETVIEEPAPAVEPEVIPEPESVVEESPVVKTEPRRKVRTV